MRERTRRQICRLAFIAGCLFPTLVTSSWVTYRLSPVYAAVEKSHWERQLFDRTGLIASIGRVEHPEGRSTLLADVELTDPDGGGSVARLRQAEVVVTRQGMVVLLSQPEVCRGKLLRLWDILHERVLRGPAPEIPVQITAGELTLEVGHRAQTFTLIRCTLDSPDEDVRAFIEFQLAGLTMPSPAQLQVQRDRQTTPASTRWQLNTATPIPCALFRDYLPGLARLGTSCVFQGTVAATEFHNAWSAALSGRFSQVDLEAATDPFPHRLTGLASVTLRHASVQEGTLVEAAGEVVSSGGTASSSFLESLNTHLRIGTPVADRERSPSQVPYSEMAFAFTITGEGLRLSGRCSAGSSGTIMNSPTGELLVGDPRQAYALVGLVRALSPESEWLVPATLEAKGLVGILAIPSRQQTVEVLADRPRTRVRLQTVK